MPVITEQELSHYILQAIFERFASRNPQFSRIAKNERQVDLLLDWMSPHFTQSVTEPIWEATVLLEKGEARGKPCKRGQSAKRTGCIPKSKQQGNRKVNSKTQGKTKSKTQGKTKSKTSKSSKTKAKAGAASQRKKAGQSSQARSKQTSSQGRKKQASADPYTPTFKVRIFSDAQLRSYRNGATTFEGVPKKVAKNITRNQAMDVLNWQNNMGENISEWNKDLPKESQLYLNTLEAGAVQKYTYLSDGPLNRRLRGDPNWRKDEIGNRIPYSDAYYDVLDEQLQTVFKKVKTFPKPVKTVRGMQLSEQDLHTLMQKSARGSVVQFAGYTSTTVVDAATQRKMDQGLTDGVRRAFKGNVSMEINAIHGVDTKPYSQLSHENELLLNHNSEFRVRRIKRTWSRRTGKLVGLKIVLDQLPPKQTTNESILTESQKPQKMRKIGRSRGRKKNSKAARKAAEVLHKLHPKHSHKFLHTDLQGISFLSEKERDVNQIAEAVLQRVAFPSSSTKQVQLLRRIGKATKQLCQLTTEPDRWLQN